MGDKLKEKSTEMVLMIIFILSFGILIMVTLIPQSKNLLFTLIKPFSEPSCLVDASVSASGHALLNTDI